MNRKHKKSKSPRKVIRVWTYPQARQALPYVTSVMRSLREHWLDAQREEARQKKLAARPGRPDRATLLAGQESAQEEHQAKERFNEAYRELQKIEVYCLDPNQGVSVLPFVHADKLAWLIYDLFDPGDYHHWRYHEDPLNQRRPIAEARQEGPADKEIVV